VRAGPETNYDIFRRPAPEALGATTPVGNVRRDPSHHSRWSRRRWNNPRSVGRFPRKKKKGPAGQRRPQDDLNREARDASPVGDPSKPTSVKTRLKKRGPPRGRETSREVLAVKSDARHSARPSRTRFPSYGGSHGRPWSGFSARRSCANLFLLCSMTPSKERVGRRGGRGQGRAGADP
jgi:hypothetical protein